MCSSGFSMMLFNLVIFYDCSLKLVNELGRMVFVSCMIYIVMISSIGEVNWFSGCCGFGGGVMVIG